MCFFPSNSFRLKTLLFINYSLVWTWTENTEYIIKSSKKDKNKKRKNIVWLADIPAGQWKDNKTPIIIAAIIIIHNNKSLNCASIDTVFCASVIVCRVSAHLCVLLLAHSDAAPKNQWRWARKRVSMIMIDWVSIVRHSRRRFSNYVGTRAPIRMKKRRRTPISVPPSVPPAPALSSASSPQDDRHQYTCCCTHVSLFFAARQTLQ